MGKMNLVEVKNRSYYCDGVFAVGVYIAGSEALLVDSGISKEVAKEVDKAVRAKGASVAAIINTHCHGDHSGGNAYFQQKYPDLEIYSSEGERPFIEDPELAPLCFCGGAEPYRELKKCKPIAPQQPSRVTKVIAPYRDQTLTLFGEEFKIVTLPGHTRAMIGLITPDNVLYCGDALFGEETCKKHPILYYTFIAETLHTFEKLEALLPTLEAVVLYHGAVAVEISKLIDYHRKLILETRESIAQMIAKEPLTHEEITARVMQDNDLPDDIISYTLTKTPIQAFITNLVNEGVAAVVVKGGVKRICSVGEATV